MEGELHQPKVSTQSRPQSFRHTQCIPPQHVAVVEQLASKGIKDLQRSTARLERPHFNEVKDLPQAEFIWCRQEGDMRISCLLPEIDYHGNFEIQYGGNVPDSYSSSGHLRSSRGGLSPPLLAHMFPLLQCKKQMPSEDTFGKVITRQIDQPEVEADC
jgi:hypothetical protein